MEQYVKNIEQNLSNHAMSLINQNILHTLYDKNCRVIACSNLSARSVGLNSSSEAIGTSYHDTDNLEFMKGIFKCKYDGSLADKIIECAQKIYSIQKTVLNANRVISYIDYIPYNGIFTPYLVTCVPFTHNNGQVIGIQSFAQKCNYLEVLSHTQIIKNMFGRINLEKASVHRDTIQNPLLTKREQEIIFLLANGLCVDEIFEFLGTSRSTVANTIAFKLSPKFGLFGSNTKLLSKAAREKGYHKLIPESLCVPCIIILDEQLSKDIH
jgi:hypothetical protein